MKQNCIDHSIDINDLSLHIIGIVRRIDLIKNIANFISYSYLDNHMFALFDLNSVGQIDNLYKKSCTFNNSERWIKRSICRKFFQCILLYKQMSSDLNI